MNLLALMKGQAHLLLLNLLVIAALVLLHPTLPIILAGGLALQLILKLWDAHKKQWIYPGFPRALAQSSLMVLGIITGFYLLQRLLGNYGLLGWLLLQVIVAAYLMWRGRTFLRGVFNQAAKDLYGQSYDEWKERKHGRKE
jgi:hypothetical protein